MTKKSGKGIIGKLTDKITGKKQNEDEQPVVKKVKAKDVETIPGKRNLFKEALASRQSARKTKDTERDEFANKVTGAGRQG